MRMTVKTHQKEYPVIQEHGILGRAAEELGPIGRAFLVSDDGVPEKWRNTLQKQYPDAVMHVIPQGEASKSFTQYQLLLEDMLKQNLSRQDTVIALGGGVVGDLTGFAASTYMRGIRYVNIPTTSLSQIDSSIGGKTAIDLDGIKNCIGCFWQPTAVLIDPDTLTTLPARQLSNGLAEAVKEGLIADERLFELFEQDDYLQHLDEIIARSLQVKKKIVEEDERETGVRKLLNFGHTWGHAYESYYHLNTWYHGECVAMGMMTVLENEEIKERLRKVLQRLHLPESCDADPDRILELIQKDKKADHDVITIVQVPEIGKGILQKKTIQELKGRTEK